MILGGTKYCSKDEERQKVQDKFQAVKILGTALKLITSPSIWKITLTLQIMEVLGFANIISKVGNMSLESGVPEKGKG